MGMTERQFAELLKQFGAQNISPIDNNEYPQKKYKYEDQWGELTGPPPEEFMGPQDDRTGSFGRSPGGRPGQVPWTNDEEMAQYMLRKFILDPNSKGRSSWSAPGSSGFGPRDQMTPEMLDAMGALTGIEQNKFKREIDKTNADTAAMQAQTASDRWSGGGRGGGESDRLDAIRKSLVTQLAASERTLIELMSQQKDSLDATEKEVYKTRIDAQQGVVQKLRDDLRSLNDPQSSRAAELMANYEAPMDDSIRLNQIQIDPSTGRPYADKPVVKDAVDPTPKRTGPNLKDPSVFDNAPVDDGQRDRSPAGKIKEAIDSDPEASPSEKKKRATLLGYLGKKTWDVGGKVLDISLLPANLLKDLSVFLGTKVGDVVMVGDQIVADGVEVTDGSLQEMLSYWIKNRQKSTEDWQNRDMESRKSGGQRLGF